MKAPVWLSIRSQKSNVKRAAMKSQGLRLSICATVIILIYFEHARIVLVPRYAPHLVAASACIVVLVTRTLYSSFLKFTNPRRYTEQRSVLFPTCTHTYMSKWYHS